MSRFQIVNQSEREAVKGNIFSGQHPIDIEKALNIGESIEMVGGTEYFRYQTIGEGGVYSISSGAKETTYFPKSTHSKVTLFGSTRRHRRQCPLHVPQIPSFQRWWL